MKLCIPELDSKLRLIQPWTVELSIERRNRVTLGHFFPEILPVRTDIERHFNRVVNERLEFYFNKTPRGTWGCSECPERLAFRKERAALIEAMRAEEAKHPMRLEIEAGQVLSVDRIYIRRGADEFSSVTFKWRASKLHRFWVPLSQANQIQFEYA